MTIGTKSDFRVYNEYMQSGVVETLTQASAAFNEASNGCIRLTSVGRKGDFMYEAFFQVVNGLVTRRVTEGGSATSAVSDVPLTQGEMVDVKLNRKIGPVAQTLDAFKKIQQGPFDQDALDFAIGVQAAKAMQVEMVNTASRAVRAALANQAAVTYSVPSSGTLNTAGLASGLATFGDASDRIVCWVMHSKPYWDLVQNQIAANILGVTGAVVASATPATLNRPVIVMDSPALLVAGTPNTYYTLGLTPGAVEVEDSEETTLLSRVEMGNENLFVRYQGEYAYNIGVKGFTWDVTNGGKNPDDTALGTGSNWDPVRASFKDFAGVVIASA